MGTRGMSVVKERKKTRREKKTTKEAIRRERRGRKIKKDWKGRSKQNGWHARIRISFILLMGSTGCGSSQLVFARYILD